MVRTPSGLISDPALRRLRRRVPAARAGLGALEGPAAAAHAHQLQTNPPADIAEFNATLRGAESALLSPEGLPNRTWYKHTIYAPGEYTGYAAVVIPGVNEAIEARDSSRASAQLTVLAQCLERAAQTLETAH